MRIVHNRIKRTLYFILVVSSIYIFSCSASVQLTYYKDPDFTGPYFSKIAVVAVVKDQDYKSAYENGISNSLRNAGLISFSGKELFIPNTDYKENELLDIIKRNDLNGILILRYTKAKIKTVVFPKGNYVQYFKDVNTMIGSGSYVENPDSLNLECTLFSTASGNAVWIATANAREYYNLSNLGSSLGKDIVNNLKKNNLIK